MDWRTFLKPNWCATALFSYCITYTPSDTSSGSGSMCTIMVILIFLLTFYCISTVGQKDDYEMSANEYETTYNRCEYQTSGAGRSDGSSGMTHADRVPRVPIQPEEEVDDELDDIEDETALEARVSVSVKGKHKRQERKPSSLPFFYLRYTITQAFDR